MHKDEQEPGTDSIDHSTDSSSTEETPVSDSPPTVSVHLHAERKALVSSENWTTPMLASGVIAVVMAVAFLFGVDSIFPSPRPAVASVESAPAVPAAESATPAESTTETPAKDATKSESTAQPATNSGGEAGPSDPAPKPEEATPSKESESAPASTKTSRRSTEGRSSAPAPLLLVHLVESTSEEAAAASAEASDRPGFFGRLVLYIKFFILVCLSAVLAMVALGGLALITDRPLGDFKGAFSRVCLSCWIATLALFVPISEAWLRDLIHYAVAALLFWLMGMLILRLSPRLSGTLLGGTVALLAVTAIGSRIVVWATW